MIWIALGIGALIAVLAFVMLGRRRPPDGLETFQRQIDALSPEARRRVVTNVRQVERRIGPTRDRGRDGA